MMCGWLGDSGGRIPHVLKVAQLVSHCWEGMNIEHESYGDATYFLKVSGGQEKQKHPNPEYDDPGNELHTFPSVPKA